MNNKRRIAFCLRSALPLMMFDSATVLAREVTFDTGVMKTLGLTSDLNHYFAEAPRFLPGTHSVYVKVNGKDRGMAAVRFDKDGVLCFDNDLLDLAGLMPVPLKAGEACHDIRDDYPKAVISALPNQEAVELYLPSEAVNSLSPDIRNFQHGGAAGVLNYSLFSIRNEYGGSDNSRYSQANLEAGFNAFDWSLRSNYILTDDNGKKNADSIYTYAEHVFVPQKLTMQVGEINAMSNVLSGIPITGIQLMPTNRLAKDGSGVSVSGIARSSQARVEIRQNNQLIFSTLVPAGPFTLDDVPIARNNVDLDVSVVESDGSSNHFIVPTAAVKQRNLSRPQGLTVSAGQVRSIDSNYSDTLVMNVSDGWRIFPWMNLLASGTAARDYQGAGGRTDLQINDIWSVSMTAAASKESFGDRNSGLKTELGSDLTLSSHVSISTSATHYNGGYREMAEAMYDDYQGYDNTYSGSVHFSSGLAGILSAGFNYNQSCRDHEDSRNLFLSWSKAFKNASVTANWQSTVSNVNYNHGNQMLYINVSMPFSAGRTISTYMRKQGDNSSYGVANGGPLGGNAHYYIAADRDQSSSENSFNGNLNTNLRYTQLSVGAGSSGNNQRNYNATLAGGVALHKNGMTFSPYAIRNTFAIARLSDKKSGIEIATPQGTVWTDAWGQAVVPSLNEWRNSRIEVDANKLPQNMTLTNGTRYIAAGHASVSEVDFRVLNSRRVMLRMKQADGQPLRKGLTVVDEQGNYIVTVVDDGHVFINDADHLPALYAMDASNNRLCKFDFALPEKRNQDVFYEDVNGVCR